jgi:hypothetical protein
VLALLLAAGAVTVFAAELAAKKPAKGPSADAEPGDASGITVLYPPDKAVLPSGDFDVICRAEDAQLRVEGEPQQWEPFEPPVRVAHVSLYGGPNTLRIGGKRIEVFVAETAAKPGGPEGWPMWRNHPINGPGEDRCSGCHELEKRGDGVAVGKLLGHKACFECHKAAEFETTHSHLLEPVESCQTCHSLHAAKEKGLLKAPAKKLRADSGAS